jgi:hypothetical protein
MASRLPTTARRPVLEDTACASPLCFQQLALPGCKDGIVLEGTEELGTDRSRPGTQRREEAYRDQCFAAVPARIQFRKTLIAL